MEISWRPNETSSGAEPAAMRLRITDAGLVLSRRSGSGIGIAPAGASRSANEAAQRIATLLPLSSISSISSSSSARASGASAAEDTVLVLAPCDMHGTSEPNRGSALTHPVPSGHSQQPPLLVNGFPPLAVTVLPDRAEVSLGPEVFFYHRSNSSEIEIFAGAKDEQCVRCKRPLETGDALLRCGVCGSPHHEGPTANPALPDLACHSYDAQCARCDHSLAPLSPVSPMPLSHEEPHRAD